MLIAFKCYDLGNNDQLNSTDVKFVLKNIPLTDTDRYGEAIGFHNKEIPLSRGEYSKQKIRDIEQID